MTEVEGEGETFQGRGGNDNDDAQEDEFLNFF